jgi:hypothetical protein
VRFWTAAALCRSFHRRTGEFKSGRGLTQSKTLTRDALNPDQLFGYSIFETALAWGFVEQFPGPDLQKMGNSDCSLN